MLIAIEMLEARKGILEESLYGGKNSGKYTREELTGRLIEVEIALKIVNAALKREKKRRSKIKWGL